ncbi:VOC family protein [Planotetraspora sp. GP83]|uniref:VOC family protein n=1 Tax=Planotetraspora sp. GP83 TaxID=3156264 RepID=UPI003511944F
MSHLGLVTIVVADYDEAIAFYVGVLGFDLIEDRPLGDRKRWVVVRPPSARTGLLIARAATRAQSARVGGRTGGRVGFFLYTDDFEADHARLVAAGVRFEEPPRRAPYGTVAVCHDMYGNRWDLLQVGLEWDVGVV